MYLLDRLTEINWITLPKLSTFSAHCSKGAKDKNQTSVHTDSQPGCWEVFIFRLVSAPLPNAEAWFLQPEYNWAVTPASSWNSDSLNTALEWTFQIELVGWEVGFSDTISAQKCGQTD